MRKLLFIMWLSFLVSVTGTPAFAAICPEYGHTMSAPHTDCPEIAAKKSGDVKKDFKILSKHCCCLILGVEVLSSDYVCNNQSEKKYFFSEVEPESNIPDSLYKPPNLA